jgi:hypothetical protein
MFTVLHTPSLRYLKLWRARLKDRSDWREAADEAQALLCGTPSTGSRRDRYLRGKN